MKHRDFLKRIGKEMTMLSLPSRVVTITMAFVAIALVSAFASTVGASAHETEHPSLTTVEGSAIAVQTQRRSLIYEKWLSIGGVHSVLGDQVSDELWTPNRVGRFAHYEYGSIH